MELTGASAGIPFNQRSRLVEVIREASSALDPVDTGMDAKIEFLSEVSVLLLDVYGTLFVSGSGDVGTAKTGHHDDHFASAVGAATGLAVGPETAVRIRESYFDTIESDHAQARRLGVAYPEVEIAGVWQRVLTSCGSELNLEFVSAELARRVAVEYEVHANPVWPMPACKRMLEGLRDAGIAVGIVSNAQFFTPMLFDSLLGAGIECLGIRREMCAWSYQLGVAKPSVEMFVHAFRGLPTGRTARNVLYVGNDMLNDVWTAKQVGCRTCLFAGDARSLRLREDRTECRDLVPDLVITRLEQLFRCVPGLRGEV